MIVKYFGNFDSLRSYYVCYERYNYLNNSHHHVIGEVKLSINFLCNLKNNFTAIHKLLSWTTVGPPKCPINKMIGWQGHLTF